MVSQSFTKCYIALKMTGYILTVWLESVKKRQNFPLSKFAAIRYMNKYTAMYIQANLCIHAFIPLHTRA